MTVEEAVRATLARGAAAVADATLRYPGALGAVMCASIRAQTQAQIDVIRMSRMSTVTSGTCAPPGEPLKPLTVKELKELMSEVTP